MQYKPYYQRRPIGWLPRSIIFLLFAAVSIRIIYRQMNHDHQYENVAILPKTNILDEIERQPEPMPNPRKFDVTNPPRMFTMEKMYEVKISLNWNYENKLHLCSQLKHIDHSPKARAHELSHNNPMEPNENVVAASNSEQV